MQIEGPLPFAAMQAYGVQNAASMTKATASAQVQQLVAGQVVGKVSFDGVDVSTLQPLQLYTRTADRIEAATRIATGQHIDIQA